MIRWIARLIGIGFVGVLLIALYGTVSDYIGSPPKATAESLFHREPKELSLESDGPLGKFDRAQLQRGLQIYTEVCSACHSLSRVSFGDLAQLGYKDGQIKAYGGSGNFWKIEVPTINPETGEPATRKATSADHFPSPYANEVQGKAANNGALPPDLSLMTKAREGGPAYVLFAADRLSGRRSRRCSSNSPRRRPLTGCITTRISPISTFTCRRR